MAERANRETHKWTPEETRRLIRFRAENEQRFLRSKYTAKQLWETLIKDLGLEGKVTGQQASKKWENLKKKYKDLKTPKTGSGTEAGEVTASSWQYFEEMHEVLGSRPSIDPPVVVSSFTDEEPITLTMESVDFSEIPAVSTTGPLPNSSEETASSSTASSLVVASPPTPSPKKKKRKSNPILDFLTEESIKEQKRHEESEAKTVRFLDLFEKMIDKL